MTKDVRERLEAIDAVLEFCREEGFSDAARVGPAGLSFGDLKHIRALLAQPTVGREEVADRIRQSVQQQTDRESDDPSGDWVEGYVDFNVVADAALLAPSGAPGHTDLMISPEAIDRFVEENPPPAEGAYDMEADAYLAGDPDLAAPEPVEEWPLTPSGPTDEMRRVRMIREAQIRNAQPDGGYDMSHLVPEPVEEGESERLRRALKGLADIAGQPIIPPGSPEHRLQMICNFAHLALRKAGHE